MNQKISDEDLKNFGEAISGFGNSEGGVIVWGIKCSKKPNGADVAHQKKPIHSPERFKRFLLGVLECGIIYHALQKPVEST